MTEKQKEDRDTELVKEVMDWHDSDLPKQEQVSAFFLRLSEKYKITERTIYQILKENASAILSHKDYERLKRVFRLKREIAQKEKSNKDVADLLEQLRKEYEGEKGAEIRIGVAINNKVGANGSFVGEDRELTDRLMGVLRSKLQK